MRTEPTAEDRRRLGELRRVPGLVRDLGYYGWMVIWSILHWTHERLTER